MEREGTGRGMTNGTDRDIGALFAMTEEQGRQLDRIIDTLDKWNGEGCPTGKRVEAQVKSVRQKLDKLQWKVVGLGVLVAGAGHGAGTILKILLGD